MIVTQVNSRDPAVNVSAPAAVAAAQPAPTTAPPSRQEQQDSFGPATRVALSSTAGSIPAQPAPKVPSSSEAVEKVISVDQETRSLVFQNLNQETGAVLSQFPDEAKLRLRAYIDELAQQQTQAATAGTHLDPSTIDGIRV